jgi:hypothetical protein
MSKINIDQKSKSMRKYAGRTIAREKQNYKTSKISWSTSMTSWTFLINCRNWRNWIIFIWDTNQSFHTEKGVIFFLNCYSWKSVCMLIEIKRNSHIKIREKNRLLTYMHGPNFKEMLETKENILWLTYIMKINSPWNCKKIKRFN